MMAGRSIPADSAEASSPLRQFTAGKPLSDKVVSTSAVAHSSAELRAIAEASASGRQVLIPGDETANSATFATPTGALRTEVSSAPINFRTSKGSWSRIDTAFEHSGRGAVVDRAGPVVVKVALKGNATRLVSVSYGHGRSISWSVRGAAAVPGVVKGSTVTFAGILPGVSLVVTDTPSGPAIDFILSTMPARAAIRLGFSLRGLKIAVGRDRALVLLSKRNTVAVIPPPTMQDASQQTDPAPSGGVTYTLEGRGDSRVVRVNLDAGWLSAAGRAFPVTIDPTTVQVGGTTSTYVTQGSTMNNSGSSVMFVGSPDGGSDISNGFVAFPTVTAGNPSLPSPSIVGGHVLSATLEAYEIHSGPNSGSCISEPTDVYQVTSPWSTSTLNSYPGPSVGGSPSVTNSAAGTDCTGNAWISWDVTSIVANWAAGQQNNGFAFEEPSTLSTNDNAFREFTSGLQGGVELFYTWSPFDATYSPSATFSTSPTASQTGYLPVTVTNTGSATWEGPYTNLVYHLNSTTPTANDQMTQIGVSLAPGQSTTVQAFVGPLSPGTYTLYWDIYDSYPWFFNGAGNPMYFYSEGVPEVAQTVIVPNTGPLATAVSPPNGTTSQYNQNTLSVTYNDPSDPSGTVSAQIQVCTGADANSGTCYYSGWQSPGGSANTVTWVTPALRWNTTWYWSAWLKDPTIENNPTWVQSLTPAITAPLNGQLGDDPYSPNQQLVNPANGNVSITSTDFSVANAGLPLSLTRTYNSSNETQGYFGWGTTSLLDYRVTVENNYEDENAPGVFNKVLIEGPDGSVKQFGQNLDGTWTGQPGTNDALTGSESTGWVLQTSSGTYYFNSFGQITKETAPGESSLTVNYPITATPLWTYNNATLANVGAVWASTQTPPTNLGPSELFSGYGNPGVTPLAGLPSSLPTGGNTLYRCANSSNYEYLSTTTTCAFTGGNWAGVTSQGVDGYSFAASQPGTEQLFECSYGNSVSYSYTACATGYLQIALGWVYTPVTGWDTTIGDGNAVTISSTPSARALHLTWGSEPVNSGRPGGGTTTPVVISIATDGVTVGSTTAPITVTYGYASSAYATLTSTCGPLSLTACSSYGYTPLLGDPELTSVTDANNNKIHQFNYTDNTAELPAAVDPRVQSQTDGNGNTTNYNGYQVLRRYNNGQYHTETVGAPSVQDGTLEATQSLLLTNPPLSGAATNPIYLCSTAPGQFISTNNCGTQVGLAYAAQQTNTTQLYECQIRDSYGFVTDDFASTSSTCEGKTVVGSLGWFPTIASEISSGVPSSTAAQVSVTTEPSDPYAANTRYTRIETFDGAGRILANQDENGALTTYGYNTAGFANQIVDPNNNITDLTSNSIGQVTASTTYITPGDPTTKYYTYASGYPIGDPRNGELLSSSNGLATGPTDTAHSTTYTYDTNGNVLTETTPTTSACPSGCVTTYTYTNGTTNTNTNGQVEPAGLPLTKTVPGQAPTQWDYTTTGDTDRVIEPQGIGYTFAYDQLGRAYAEAAWMTETGGSPPVTWYVYNGAGQILSQTDGAVTDAVTGSQHALVTTNTYDNDGRLLRQALSDAKAVDPSRTTTYTYDLNGNQTTITDPAGRKTTNTYDYKDNLKTATNNAGTVTAYTYTPAGLLASKTLQGYIGAPQNPSTAKNLTLDSRSYDPAGRLTAETNSAGYTTAYTYYDNNLQATVTLQNDNNSAGNTFSTVEHSYTYDQAGDITADMAAGGLRQTSNTYDNNAEPLTTIAGPPGNTVTTTNTYNQAGQVITTNITGAGGVNTTTTYTYNTAGEKASQTVASGTLNLTTSWTYDNTAHVLSTKDPNGNTTTYNYDPNNNLITTTDPTVATSANGGTPTNVAPVTTNGYDTYGDLVESVDRNGKKTTYAFNPDGQKTSETLPSYVTTNTSTLGLAGTTITPSETWTYNNIGAPATHTDPDGNTTTYITDQLGRTTETTSASNATNPAAVSQTGYSNAGAPLVTVDPDGNQVWTAYNAENQPVEVALYTATTKSWSYYYAAYDAASDTLSTTDADGNVTTYGYDAQGNRTSTTQPAASGDTTNRTTNYTYNAFGKPLSVTDPLGHQTVYTYDQVGRTTSVTPEYANAAVVPAATYGYDNNGNTVKETSPNGWATTVAYNADNEPTATTQQLTSTTNLVTSQTYDPAGNVTSSTDGNGNTTIYEYDGQGLPVATVQPSTAALPNQSSHEWTATYDPAGHLLVKQTPGGSTTTDSYTPRENLATETVTGSGPPITNTYTYDANGNLASFNTPTGTESAAYNAFGEPLTATGPEGNLTASYDANGNPLTVTDAAGTNTYTYNPQGKIATANIGLSALKETFAYNADNQLVTETYPSGATQNWLYDNMGRQIGEENIPSAGANMSQWGWYAYDSDSNITLMDQAATINGVTTSSWGDKYTYDGADRLTSWYNPVNNTTTNYTWDGANNLITQGSTTYAHNADNQLTTSTNGSATTNYTYNLNGDLTSIATGSTTTTYGYDNADRHTSTNTGSATNTYSYDGINRPANVNTNAVTYDATTAEPTGIGTTLIARLPNGTPEAQSAGGTVTIPVINGTHGDINAQLNSTGVSPTSYTTYTPLGMPTTLGGTNTSVLGFQGQLTLPDGNTHMGARDYNPAIGAFQSLDSYTVAPNVNPALTNYAYTNGNPLNSTDPSGHDCWFCVSGALRIVNDTLNVATVALAIPSDGSDTVVDAGLKETIDEGISQLAGDATKTVEEETLSATAEAEAEQTAERAAIGETDTAAYDAEQQAEMEAADTEFAQEQQAQMAAESAAYGQQVDEGVAAAEQSMAQEEAQVAAGEQLDAEQVAAETQQEAIQQAEFAAEDAAYQASLDAEIAANEKAWEAEQQAQEAATLAQECTSQVGSCLNGQYNYWGWTEDGQPLSSAAPSPEITTVSTTPGETAPDPTPTSISAPMVADNGVPINQATATVEDRGAPSQLADGATAVPNQAQEAQLAAQNESTAGFSGTMAEPNGEFSIANWSDYPTAGGVPQPEGPFRILQGQEYQDARDAANAANRALHTSDPSYDGLQIHEIQPVKFGGSPTDIANKIGLTQQEHALYTTWWNRLLRQVGG